MQEQIKGIELVAEKRLAAKRDEKIALEKDLLDLSKDIAERRAVLTSKAATVATEFANVPKPPPNAVMIPVLPGNILYSNHVKPESMLQAAMNDPGLLSAGGFSPEQAAAFTKWSLTYINSMSLVVPESQGATVPDDLQTLQGKADAVAAAARAADEAKRKAEDDDVYTEVSMSEGRWTDKTATDRGDDKVPTKEQIKRSEKKAKQAGKGTDKK